MSYASRDRHMPDHIARDHEPTKSLCGRDTYDAAERPHGVMVAPAGSKSVECRTCQRIWSRRHGRPYPQPSPYGEVRR